MSDSHYDVIVVGLGAMGSATLYQLAKRGAKVLGIDRFTPPHTMGSSHGDTRITRQAIGEGEMYMPFIRRSNEIWRELEAETGRGLYITSGGLIIAPEQDSAEWHHDGDFVSSTARTAQKFGIEHTVLSAGETIQRHPILKMRPQDRAYFEPGAGLLRPELCIQTQLELAKKHGATVHTGEMVTGYADRNDGAFVITQNGKYEADKLVLSAGAWMVNFWSKDYPQQLSIYRQVIYWFEAEDIEQFTEGNFPFLIWIGDKDEDFFSAFPTPKDGIQAVKVLTEEYVQKSQPDSLDRVVKQHEIDHLYAMTEARLHGITNKLIHSDVCMYTSTADHHFILDFDPNSERVVIASPCSGHGFKHSAAVGETLAEMALTGTSTIDIRAFSIHRPTI